MILKKNLLVIIGLVVLVGWGIYDFTTSKTGSSKVEQTEKDSVATTGNINADIGIQEGNKAPDFQLQTLDGKEMKLSDMAGKKVILNFWATWCPPCKAEMPHMQEFYSEQKDNGIEIVAVNLTTAEKNQDDIGKFIKDYGLTFPVLLDSPGEVGQTYQAFTIPTSYIIDSNGIIRKKIVGPMDKDMMKGLTDSIE
ncbi:peroxiredoxin family protein [Neobacillus sp. D3-1R]|uniref:peroxiredoxin family protein n=1 Tax=Neobacillus sp. D3-1R TaxID=3445778 RepID=UPI003F9F270F